MTKILISSFVGLLCYAMICFVNADVCEVSDCFDSNNYECTEFEWTALDNYSKTIGGDCIILRSKSIDFAGHTLNFTAYDGDGTGGEHFNVIKIVGSGSISNGIINLFSGGGPGLRDCPDIFVNQTTGSGSVVVDNMKIKNQNVYSTSVSRPFYAVSNVNPQLYITNTAFRNYDGSHPDGMIDLTKYNGSIFFVNSNITSLYASDTFGVVFGDYYALSITSTKIQSFVNNLKFTTNTEPTINSLFSCYGTTTDITSLYPFTISSSGIYSDVIVNMTIPNLNECWEFTEFENETPPATNASKIVCDNTPTITTLEGVGLTKYWTVLTSDNLGVAAKITMLNPTLYNSFAITENNLCFRNAADHSIVVCEPAQASTDMRPTMIDNLAGGANITIGTYNEYTGGWLDFLSGGTEAARAEFITEQYCAPYFPPDPIFHIYLFDKCSNGGFKYELINTQIMSGTYDEILVLKNASGCVINIALGRAVINGYLAVDGIGIDNMHPTQQPTDNSQINIPTVIGTNITALNQTTPNNKTNISEICVTFYDWNTNELKADTIIFHLTENLTTYYDVTHDADKIIASCIATKNLAGGYASCVMCFNANPSSFYGYFTEIINVADGQDDITYLGSLATGANGYINDTYRVYIDGNGDNTSRPVNYTSGWYSTYPVNQTYYYYTAPESAFSWYDILFWGIIIFFVIIVLWLIMGVLTRSPTKKYYSGGYSRR